MNKKVEALKIKALENHKVKMSEIEEVCSPGSELYNELTDFFLMSDVSVVGEDGKEIVEEIDESTIDADNVRYFKMDDTMSIYNNDIKKYPLLTPEEEIVLGNAVQEGIKAQEKLDDKKLKLTKTEITKLKKIVDTGLIAKEKFTNANLRLAIWWTKSYKNRGLPQEDLIQEGNKGLIKAVEKFSPDMGNRFSTYASNWIRKHIVRAIQNQARTVRVPVHVSTLISKMRKSERKIEAEKGMLPTDEQIAEDMKITVEKVREIKLYANDTVSLDQPVGEEENISLGDLVPNPNTKDAFDEMSQNKFDDELYDLLESLSQREYQVIALRYGLWDNQQRTLEDIGNAIGLTRERVRQIEAKAFRKLRHPSRSGKIKQYLE